MCTSPRLRPLWMAVLCLAAAPAVAAAQSAGAAAANDLDALMEKALAKREQNRLTLERYVLDEVEDVEILGPGRTPVLRHHREFTWYVRDGLHVRSPVRFDGVQVGEGARAEYEADWMRRERERLERRSKKDADRGAPSELDAAQPIGPAGTAPIPAPRFVSEAYFMEFKFEPGNYFLAGRESLEGHEVLRIEYYPTQMFGDSEDEERERRRGKRTDDPDYDTRIQRQMNKTALITLWVDPSEHQIVKYRFDNVWMDFLPGAWLVRVNEIHASMTMGRPFPGVWLPRELTVGAEVTLASGSFDGEYRRQFRNYRLAEVTTRITIPKAPDARFDPWPEDGGSGPYVPEPDQARETIAEIRVHGNVAIPDADILRVAGIEPGQPIGEADLAEIERRLNESGLFESVEVRKRYRSLTDMSAVALLLVVHEKPGVSSVDDEAGALGGPWRRLRRSTMFLPILSYADGYGLTYGGRFSTVDLFGAGERLSVPLTWGGTRRAALEFERTFRRGPITRLASSFGISQRENPHFEIDDRRLEWRGRAERQFFGTLRAGIAGTASAVTFGSLDDRLWTAGADAAFDTRADPAFPRNALFLGAGWSGLHARSLDGRINRYTADTRGYWGVIGQAVLAGRVQYEAADAPLPPYERLLLGGASTLRGFRAGAFAGDRTLVTSAELRVPLTSVLRTARLGVTAFFDAAKAWDAGGRFDDAEWRRAAGAGVFLIAPVVRLNLDVARALEIDETRVHVAMGFAF